ncbi:MAG: YHYH protein [Alphaproteobacteria bacterium]|nr:YHYH protein [Alphaproteobacteria bacterium]MCB9795361.1 YHYH protein [Alphaproteobacteria bacterium]
MFMTLLSLLACDAGKVADSGEIDLEPDVDPGERCAAIQQSVAYAGFSSSVSVTCDETQATFSSDTYPDHTKMDGIVSTIEQIPVPATWEPRIPLQPRQADSLGTQDAAIAVAVNGVPIYDYSAGGELDPTQYDEAYDTLLLGQLDVCNGHAGRGDDYHYHAFPLCMVDQIQNASDDTVVGWAFDGYPIYGYNNPDGTVIEQGSLGTCNGKPDATYGWRYHASTSPPYFIQCLDGVADLDSQPRVPPLSAAEGGGERPYGMTAGGVYVDDLTLSELSGGRVEMRWFVDGQEYGIRYEPSETEGCYDFEIDLISGEVHTGEYCRE